MRNSSRFLNTIVETRAALTLLALDPKQTYSASLKLETAQYQTHYLSSSSTLSYLFVIVITAILPFDMTLVAIPVAIPSSNFDIILPAVSSVLLRKGVRSYAWLNILGP